MKFRAFNQYLCSRRERMASFPEGRRSRRVATKKRASLVITLSGVQKMFPCLIVDRSEEGFRLRGNFRLRRVQLVELVLDDPVHSRRCEVIWVGKPQSQQLAATGFQTLPKSLSPLHLYPPTTPP